MAKMELDPAMIPEAVSWCVAHGAVYALPHADAEALGEAYEVGGAFSHAPFSLAPFPWPRSEYEKVCEIQKTLCLVVDRASRDGAWLERVLIETVASDEFTANVFRVYREHPNPQPLTLGLLRSDYMLDEKDGVSRSLQVEINTIASSFACLSETISRLHRYLAAKNKSNLEELPPNAAGRGLAAGIAEAHRAYASRRSVSSPRVAMVVQPNERNQMDQRMLEHALWDDHGIPMQRVTLKELAKADTAPGKPLVLDGVEFSVVYFRAGYSPDDYPTSDEWTARGLVEASLAVKCPSAAYQLAGTKKVQQALAAPGALERFVGRSGDASAREVREVFAGLFDLDEAAPGADDAVARALDAPQAFVLKPQREGGGNNLYDADLADALRAMTPAQRAAYILMERITSKPKPGALVRNGIATAGDCVAELGVYGAFLADGPDAVLLNDVCGHLLRQKLLGVNEGGVAAGFAVLSSPALF
ncbi:hypothetical protein CTAYLR_001001 [Chrysophaeum taylorii]|uniref:Glutathione synthetase n=1 Tax=Chrysophaeum taylorii TaxID=2483200 RepID=A0AAD7XMW2_9STRA|nr:hypothetical protein CTAYLR_001001 [Chrysophaeum taylorii]